MEQDFGLKVVVKFEDLSLIYVFQNKFSKLREEITQEKDRN